MATRLRTLYDSDLPSNLGDLGAPLSLLDTLAMMFLFYHNCEPYIQISLCSSRNNKREQTRGFFSSSSVGQLPKKLLVRN